MGRGGAPGLHITLMGDIDMNEMEGDISLSWPMAELMENDQFILRKPQLADASDIIKNYAQDDEVLRYLVWKKHHNLAASEEFLQYCMNEWQTGHSTPYVIVSKKNMQVIGMIDLRKNRHCVTLGYVLARTYWNQGCMTAACRLLLTLLWQRPDIFRIEAVCDVENAASARVLEKAGMAREGVLRSYILHPNRSPLPRDVYCYAAVRQ